MNITFFIQYSFTSITAFALDPGVADRAKTLKCAPAFSSSFITCKSLMRLLIQHFLNNISVIYKELASNPRPPILWSEFIYFFIALRLFLMAYPDLSSYVLKHPEKNYLAIELVNRTEHIV